MTVESGQPAQRRLLGYDYSQAGAYFITIATGYHAPVLGAVTDGEMHRSDAGIIAQSVWESLPSRYPGLTLDEFVVMPNHVHGILFLPEQRDQSHPFSLSHIIRTFKAASTRLIRSGPLPSFAWQPNYHEHVIRNDPDVQRIREYIVNNPLRWSLDRANPDHYAGT